MQCVFKETRSLKRLHIIFVIRLHKSAYIYYSIITACSVSNTYIHAHNATVLCFEWNETELSIIFYYRCVRVKKNTMLEEFRYFSSRKTWEFFFLHSQSQIMYPTFEKREWYFVIVYQMRFPFLNKWRRKKYFLGASSVNSE